VAECFRSSQGEPSSMQMEDRLVRSAKRRMNPVPRYAAYRVRFAKVTSSRGKTRSIMASNGSRASIPREAPFMELDIARVAAMIAPSSGSSGWVTT
jgi:hypothetical protein